LSVVGRLLPLVCCLLHVSVQCAHLSQELALGRSCS
jgi:hypothetical protein